MKQDNLKTRSIIPAVIMVCFTGLLLTALVFRVLRADRDLGMIRVAERQARLAAESGSQYALEKIRKVLTSEAPIRSVTTMTASYFSDRITIDKWVKYGLKTDAKFRIVGIRNISSVDDKKTKLINESLRLQVITQGMSGGNTYSVSAIIQLYDIVPLFSVFNSLNEYYYGIPFQPWIETARSVKDFLTANIDILSLGHITERGICHDVKLLNSIYSINGKSPFKSPISGSKMFENYSRDYSMNGSSPCKGPLYCSSPIIMDTHQFYGPLQTALYLFRRKGARPRISVRNSVYTLNSSMRMQKAIGKLEGKNLSDIVVDRDTNLSSSYIPSWNPDFDMLKNFAKKWGIYIDADGNGYRNGTKTDVDYHAGERHIYSDSYKTANSTNYEQDDLTEKYIVLSTDSKYDRKNNLKASLLKGSGIIYSERAVYIRGEIGHDLVIVSPKHIYITGPTNVDSAFNLFLLARSGTAISTVDLEQYIKDEKPGIDFINAAREWIVRAIIYKPGAGVYTSSSRPQKNAAGIIQPVTFKRVFAGHSLKIKILGSCIGGNLIRWINNVEKDGLTINWNPGGANRLPVRPIVANIIQSQTSQE